MKPSLFAHPFASYCQKVLIALYENGTDFTYRQIGPEDPTAMSELESLWLLKKFPVLLDEGRAHVESSLIIEYLDMRHPGPIVLVPRDPDEALEVRMVDRFLMRADADRDPVGVREARDLLEKAYGWLNGAMENKTWAAGEAFTMGDCAAAPSLLYANWVHEITAKHARVREYRARLLARPSVARTVDEARPFRHFFPPGAPNRD